MCSWRLHEKVPSGLATHLLLISFSWTCQVQFTKPAKCLLGMHVTVREDCIPVILSTAESRALFRLAGAAYGTAWLLLVGKFYFWSSFTHCHPGMCAYTSITAGIHWVWPRCDGWSGVGHVGTEKTSGCYHRALLLRTVVVNQLFVYCLHNL